MALDVAMGDQADGTAEEGFTEGAQAGAVWLASLRDHMADASLPAQAAVLVAVVAAVGQQCVEPSSGSADLARDGGNLVEQRGSSWDRSRYGTKRGSSDEAWCVESTTATTRRLTSSHHPADLHHHP